MAKSSASRIHEVKVSSSGTGERFRGSSDIPLAPEGVAKARALAKEIAKKGGLDYIYASKMKRTARTAEILSNATGAKIVWTEEFVDWALGGLEGKPVNDETIAIQNEFLLDKPDTKVLGRGPLSTRDGESFNAFRKRGTKYTMDDVIPRAEKEPDVRRAYIVNFRFIKLVKAWIKAGADKDGSIDTDEMVKYLKNNDSPPGSIAKLVVGEGDKPKLQEIDIFDVPKLDGNVFLIRHSTTAWNKPENDTKDDDE